MVWDEKFPGTPSYVRLDLFLTCRQTSVSLSVLNTLTRSSLLATWPLETFVNTVCVCNTSSRSFSLVEEKIAKIITSNFCVTTLWSHTFCPAKIEPYSCSRQFQISSLLASYAPRRHW